MLSIEAIDAHTLGQQGRVVFSTAGLLSVPGETLLDKMLHIEAHEDWFRRLMLREPRGFPRACVNLVLPPCDPRASAAFIIMEQYRIYPGMSGTNTIIVATVLLETGRIAMQEPVTQFLLEAPAGLIEITAHCAGGRVTKVEFANVPSFVQTAGCRLDVPGIGEVNVDIAFGGMGYAVVDASQFGLEVRPENGKQMQAAGIAIARAAQQAIGFRHPTEPAFAEIEGTVLYNPPSGSRTRFRQTTLNVAGQMDPTPAGTGASAFLACAHARGLVKPGETLEIDGMLGQAFHCTVDRVCEVGQTPAIVPRIGGRAWISAFSRYVLSPDDPFPEGFMIGDMWPGMDASSSARDMVFRMRSGEIDPDDALAPQD